MGPADVIGHPLVVEEHCLTFSQDDVLLRFTPKTPAEIITIAHPMPGTQTPDLTPTAMFGGYPLALSPAGYVFGDDQIHPYLATFSNLTQPVWHRDILKTLGVPAVQGDLIYTNVGGPSALSAIVALGARDGKTQWEYAPFGYPAEPVVPIERRTSRPLDLLEQIELQKMKMAMARIPKFKQAPMEWAAQTSVEMKMTTPALDCLHGHWLNPGIVTAGDRVYGEVGQRIVALAKDTGAEVWSYELKPDEVSRSIVATKDNLFVSLPKRLIALDLESGTLQWFAEVPRSGTLSIGSGRVFLAMGETNRMAKGGGELLVFGSDQKGGR